MSETKIVYGVMTHSRGRGPHINCDDPGCECGCPIPNRTGAQYCEGCGNGPQLCTCDDALMPTTIVQSGNHATGLRPEFQSGICENSDDVLLELRLDYGAIVANERHRHAPIQSQPIDDDEDILIPLRVC